MRHSSLHIAIALVATLVAPSYVFAQGGPGNDIYLVAMSSSGGVLSFGAATNVTDRAGYDNQPSFLPDGSAVLYTSNRGDQTDIYMYDIATRATSAVTSTSPESEYSAAVTPHGNTFSAIRVEADSTQRLWQFDLDGTNAQVLLPDIKPVGYHAWGNANILGIFVLGSPATFQIADIRTGVGQIIAYNVGRSIHKVPNRHAISFSHRVPESWIKTIDIHSREVRPLVQLLDGDDYAWTPDGSVLTGSGSKLFRWRPVGGSEWEEVADFTAAGVQNISRLAVSADGKWVAVVGARQ